MNRITWTLVACSILSSAVLLPAKEVKLKVANNSFEQTEDYGIDRPASWTLENSGSALESQASHNACHDGGRRLATQAYGPEVDRCYQVIDIKRFARVVDKGFSTLNVECWGRGLSKDVGKIWVACLAADNSTLSTSEAVVTTKGEWHPLKITDHPVAKGTRSIQIWLSLDRSVDGGSVTDAYLDGPISATLNLASHKAEQIRDRP